MTAITVQRDLGGIDAYAMAVAGGYTGTRAEFIAAQAQIATTASQAAASAAAAATSATTATTKAAEAAQSASTASTAKTAAEEARDDAIEAKEEIEAKLSAAYVYGIDYTTADVLSTQACQKVVLNSLHDSVGDPLRYTYVNDFQAMPAHNWKRCVMDNLATRHVNYYLHPSDSSKKADGTAAVLTGADGDVMVEIPITYVRTDVYMDSNNVEHYVWLVSADSFTGSRPDPFFYVSPDGATLRTQYVGAFRSVVCDASGVAKTQSAENTPASYASGNKMRSITGARGCANISRAQFRNGSIANGGTNCSVMFKWFLIKMMGIEFGNINSQEALSIGYSNTSAYYYAGIRKNGRTLSFGNGSGQIEADDLASTGADYDILSMKSGATNWNSTATADHSKRIVSCSYRGIEDPYGGMYEFDDGIQKNQGGNMTEIVLSGTTYYRNATLDNANAVTWAWKYNNETRYTPACIRTGYGQLSAANNPNLNAYLTNNVTAMSSASLTFNGNVYERYADGDTVHTAYAWTSTGNVTVWSLSDNPYHSYFIIYTDSGTTTYKGTGGSGFYKHAGFWITSATGKYSWLDTDRGTGDDNAEFPVSGYTGDNGVWVANRFPVGEGYKLLFDRLTFFANKMTSGSASKGLGDYWFNATNAGARVVVRGGGSLGGGYVGAGCVGVYYGLMRADSNIGGRLGA